MIEASSAKAYPVIHINSVATLLSLFVIIALLVIIHMSIDFCDSRRVCGGYTEFARENRWLFNLHTEANLPTWFSVVQLAATSLALFVTSSLHMNQRGVILGWKMLSAMFLYLSLDEATDLHGAWIAFLPDNAFLLNQRSSFDWVIPGLAVVAIVSMMFLPWLKQLPRKTIILFTVAGATYVLGAIGLELIGALTYSPAPNSSNVLYGLVATAEETLEMLGVAIMLSAVLDTWRGSQIVISGDP